MPITFLVLGIEPSGFDSSVNSFASNIAFDHAGLDLIDDGGTRTQIRNGFSHFSGEPAERTPGQVSINERRRFVLLDGQAGPDQWKVLYIDNDFSSRDTDAVRAAIDAVAPSGSGEVSPMEPDPATLDSDMDGLNDAFELTHGLDPEDPADAQSDLDGDGLTNTQEFVAGTSPSDPESALKITTILTSADEIGLQWTSVSGIAYQVEATDDLSAPNWNVLTEVVADGATTETVHARNDSRFYRVRVMPSS